MGRKPIFSLAPPRYHRMIGNETVISARALPVQMQWDKP
jgi:hypothetical protein